MKSCLSTSAAEQLLKVALAAVLVASTAHAKKILPGGWYDVNADDPELYRLTNAVYMDYWISNGIVFNMRTAKAQAVNGKNYFVQFHADEDLRGYLDCAAYFNVPPNSITARNVVINCYQQTSALSEMMKL